MKAWEGCPASLRFHSCTFLTGSAKGASTRLLSACGVAANSQVHFLIIWLLAGTCASASLTWTTLWQAWCQAMGVDCYIWLVG